MHTLRTLGRLSIMTVKKKTLPKGNAKTGPSRANVANKALENKREIHQVSTGIPGNVPILPTVLPKRKRVRVEREQDNDEEFIVKPEDGTLKAEELSAT